MDIRLALMAGTDLPVLECMLVLHQPRIKEIALMGENSFFQAVQCLTINGSMMDESLSQNLNNFQIFMMIMTAKETIEQKNNVVTLLSLILPDYKVSITPRSIILSAQEQIVTIDESNFDSLQEILKQMFCFSKNSDQSNFNPVDDKAKEIAKKLQRGRERIAAQHQNENFSSIFSQYLSVLTVGLGSMSLEDCLNLTMYQMFDLIERFGLFTNWDLEIKSRLAGAKGDGQPENWMKSIH